MTVLIVRTEPGATDFATRLTKEGVDAIACPVSEIETISGPLMQPEPMRAVIFTSAHAVRAYVGKGGTTNVPAFAVGNATARQAKAGGFQQVHSAGSDVQGLFRMVCELLPQGDEFLYYPAARDVAADLPDLLRQEGYNVWKQDLYDAKMVENLNQSANYSLRTRTATGVALFSSQNAMNFATLANRSGHVEALSGMYALCLSENVAASLRTVHPTSIWQRIIIAEEPTGDAMADAIRLASRN